MIYIIHIIHLIHVIHILHILHIIHIRTIFRIVVCFHCRQKFTVEGLDPVSVLAEAENRSNTQAYETVSGDTTNAPLSIPCGQIMTGSSRWLPLNGFAGNGLQYIRCTPVYLVCPSNWLYRVKWSMCRGESCSSNVWRRAVIWKNNYHNSYNLHNSKLCV